MQLGLYSIICVRLYFIKFNEDNKIKMATWKLLNWAKKAFWVNDRHHIERLQEYGMYYCNLVHKSYLGDEFHK
jgi:hypothetical protein